MSINEYLKVHEIAELFGLNVQTLHYYDKVGILKPNYRDPNNGYRKYKFDQIYQLASIRYMRKIGYSIEAVKDFQNSRNAQETLIRLRERSEAIRKQWEELMKIDEAIMRKIQFIENALPDVRVDEIEIIERPERKYIPIGVEEKLYMDESFYFYPTLVLYGGDTCLTADYFGCHQNTIRYRLGKIKALLHLESETEQDFYAVLAAAMRLYLIKESE